MLALLVFTVFLCSAVAQTVEVPAVCSLAYSAFNGTYKTGTFAGQTYTITFGSNINGQIGAVHVVGTAAPVAHFTSWVDSQLGTVTVSGLDTIVCTDSEEKTYKIQWSLGCKSFSLTPLVPDTCVLRRDILSTMSVDRIFANEGCFDIGSRLSGTYNEANDTLSELPFSIIFASEGYAIESNNVEVIFTQWTKDEDSDIYTITQLATTTTPFPLCGDQGGRYYVYSDPEGGCAATFCPVSDECEIRHALLNGVNLNGAEGTCNFNLPSGFGSTCSGKGEPWEDSADACLEAGSCVYCEVRYQNENTAYCLDRLGLECSDIFNSPSMLTYCNLDFVCTASITSFSLFVAVIALFVLFL